MRAQAHCAQRPEGRGDGHTVGHLRAYAVDVLELVLVAQGTEGALRLLVNEAVRPFIGGDPAGHVPAQSEMAGMKGDLVAQCELTSSGAGRGRLPAGG